MGSETLKIFFFFFVSVIAVHGDLWRLMHFQSELFLFGLLSRLMVITMCLVVDPETLKIVR